MRMHSEDAHVHIQGDVQYIHAQPVSADAVADAWSTPTWWRQQLLQQLLGAPSGPPRKCCWQALVQAGASGEQQPDLLYGTLLAGGVDYLPHTLQTS